MKLSAKFVKTMLSGHSQIGLIVGALMYLICLTGSLAVFFEEFERWEQPKVEEYHTLASEPIQQAVTEFNQRVNNQALPLYVVLPTNDVPRAHISDGEHEWFVDRDGTLSEPPVEGWTHMLKELHINLHLPQTFGLVLVSILGVMLLKLCISGVLSHPRIIKDAFKLRVGGVAQQQHVDFHNRLSVWGLPFHIMIGLTGAFFGLMGVLMSVAAPAYYDGSQERLLSDIYGADPVLEQSAGQLNFQRALDSLQQQSPNATPIYLVVHQRNKSGQYIEIAATLPGRLIYSEMFRFTQEGEYINHQGLSDGATGRQILYSVYRLHFGHFGHFGLKVFYFLLGLALAYIAVSGINIWLSKRGGQDRINWIWSACVWGMPLALSISAAGALLAFSPIWVFLLALNSSVVFCLFVKDSGASDIYLRKALGGSLLLLTGIYYIRFYADMSFLSVSVNLVLMVAAIFLLAMKNKLASGKPVARNNQPA